MSILQKLKAFFAKLFGSVQSDETTPVAPVRPVVTGFIPGEPDARDHVYTGAPGPTAPATVAPTTDVTFGASYSTSSTDGNLGLTALPGVVDLTSKMTAVEDQGIINSCVGHATTSAFEALTGVSDRSRLFAYYNARAQANQQNSDAGCTVRNALKAISLNGLAAESLFPYDISQVTVKPSAQVYADGLPLKAKIASYATITTFDAFKTALSNGIPVLFGFNVPASFRTSTPSTGIQQLQQPGEAIIGGHCVLAVGFDDGTQMVKVRNSFGGAWGRSGYFFMPYAWFTNIGKTFGNLIIDPWVMVPVK